MHSDQSNNESGLQPGLHTDCENCFMSNWTKEFIVGLVIKINNLILKSEIM